MCCIALKNLQVGLLPATWSGRSARTPTGSGGAAAARCWRDPTAAAPCTPPPAPSRRVADAATSTKAIKCHHSSIGPWAWPVASAEPIPGADRAKLSGRSVAHHHRPWCHPSPRRTSTVPHSEVTWVAFAIKNGARAHSVWSPRGPVGKSSGTGGFQSSVVSDRVGGSLGPRVRRPHRSVGY